MSTAIPKMIPKISMVFHPEAETREELLSVSKKFVTIPGYGRNLPLSSLKFPEFLVLCTEPKTDEEKESILLDFKNKLKSVPKLDNFYVFDVLCLYALYYVYESSSASLSAVSRSLYAWYKLDDLLSHGDEQRNSLIEPNNDSFLAEFGQFTDFYTNSEGLKVLAFAGYESFMSGNLGLTRFMLRYGLIDFDCNENSIQILSMVLERFKKNCEVMTSIDLRGLALQIKESKFTYRRSVLTFFTIVLVAEYKMFEWAASECDESVYERLKCNSISKLGCLDLLISASTEEKITYKDIEYFIASILNPFPISKFSMCDFLKTYQAMSSEVKENYNARSLKDLARCKIRACLSSQQMLPQQVKMLPVADPLKEFILFQHEGIWELLIKNHVKCIS